MVVVVEDVAGLVVWVVEGTEVVTAAVAWDVVWVGDTVWVAFAAPTGSTTITAQTRTTNNTIVTVVGELLPMALFKMFHPLLLAI
jgi:hypothetical protein